MLNLSRNESDKRELFSNGFEMADRMVYDFYFFCVLFLLTSKENFQVLNF